MASKKRNPRKGQTRTIKKHSSIPVPQSLDRAIELHKTGQIEQAEAHYLETLEKSPDHGRCMYLLGLLYSQNNDPERAQSYMARGLELDPISPSGHNNLGTVYLRLDRLDDAESHFRKALSQDSNLAGALINLGSVCQTKGIHTEAEVCFRKVLELDPNSPEAGVNLGALLRLKGELGEAETVLRHAIESAPDLASAHNNLGIVLHESERLLDAFMVFKKALEIDPEYKEAYNNMGSVFRDHNQPDPALACFDKALKLDANFVDAHNNKGALLQNLGRLSEAEIHFSHANVLKPNYPPALTNLANVLNKTGRHSEARAMYIKAIQLDPDYPEAHFGLAELLLFLGDELERGWQEHFWRWKKKELRDQWNDFDCPLWQGQPINKKNILVWSEQGIGEEIMYATMIPDLIEAGARVIVECEQRLQPLFRRAFPRAHCIARADTKTIAQNLDYHCAAADLGQWLRPKMASYPKRQNLLKADPTQTRQIRERYQSLGEGPIIGISWFSKNPEMGWEKSIDLVNWEPLLSRIKTATFVDLQYGNTQAERSQLETKTGIKLVHDDRIDQMQDLDGFASQVAAMDMVISISNTTVHMAGALGVPTWALLSTAPLWRWFKDRDDCLWYPSVRFIRQTAHGSWDGVIEKAAAEMERHFG